MKAGLFCVKKDGVWWLRKLGFIGRKSRKTYILKDGFQDTVNCYPKMDS